ncbi:GNAT family N-acetyltransferase [Dokdonella soli]|uniref:GNAT family N-acetyltransferase n=1 Tax=Dokdonella soli TaxID=529810 RepID=A0ABN1IQP9_9GAMM
MSQEVVDNPSHHRYELVIDGNTAFVTYRREPGLITFIHTVVPPPLGGRGLASVLARAVFEAARTHGEKVIPQCPVVAAYIQKHPEFQDLVARPSP